MTRPALAVLGSGLVDPAAPAIRADDLAVLRGDGVFESVRVHAGHPVLLAAHLDRMRSGAERLRLPLPTAAQWTDLAAAAVDESGAGDAVLKLVATRGPEGAGRGVAFAYVAPVPARVVAGRERGVHAVTLTLGLDPAAVAASPWLLRGVKTTSYAVNMATLRAAEEAGADEAVWVAADGTVLEAPTSNVVWVSGDRAVTPPAGAGLLRGVTLGALRAAAATLGVTVEERAGTVDELRAAGEVMLTSSIRGVAPVLSLDGKPVGDGTAGPVTAVLRDAYERLCATPP